MVAYFHNRTDAGSQLANEILNNHGDLRKNPAVVVLGLARGGVPVAALVAKALNTPVDVLVVRKLGMPSNEEYAFGALAPGNISYINEEIVSRAGLSSAQIQQIITEQQEVLNQRQEKYRSGRPPIDLENLTVIIVDDGIATGATMRAAIEFARNRNAEKVIVAVPVSPTDVRKEFEALADEFICPNEEISYSGVGQFYEDFGQVDDAEVIEALGSKEQSGGTSSNLD